MSRSHEGHANLLSNACDCGSDMSYLQASVKEMLDQLVWWAKALRAARSQDVLYPAAWWPSLKMTFR
jgi:hypothetical protein